MQQPPGPHQQAPYPSAPPPAKPKGGFPTWLIVVLAIIGFFVLIVGPLATLAISGMNRYLGAAKSSEAKVTVGAISRAAVVAYERSAGSGPAQLCDSAVPVPATLASVRAMKYTPREGGVDFDTGTPTAGWRCLMFAMNTPMYYRYNYIRGSGYLVPSLAPGANAFEASAQGDLNGDGAPSTFAITGAVGPSGAVVIRPQIYIENEFE